MSPSTAPRPSRRPRCTPYDVDGPNAGGDAADVALSGRVLSTVSVWWTTSRTPPAEKRDLVIPSHDVSAAQQTMVAVGVLDAVSENQA